LKNKMALLVLLLLLVGCSTHSMGETSPQRKENRQHPHESTQRSHVILKKIIANDSTETATPHDTVKNEIQWELSDGTIKKQTENSIKWSSQLANYAIVALKVPKVSTDWYNFAFLERQNGSWKIKGYMDLPINASDLTRDKKGINIPLKSYYVADDSIDDQYTVWVFTDGKKAFTIARYPWEEPLSPPAGFDEIKIRNHSARISSQNGKTSLYYVEGEDIVSIAGDLSKSEAVVLAKSLSLSFSALFPFKR